MLLKSGGCELANIGMNTYYYIVTWCDCLPAASEGSE